MDEGRCAGAQAALPEQNTSCKDRQNDKTNRWRTTPESVPAWAISRTPTIEAPLSPVLWGPTIPSRPASSGETGIGTGQESLILLGTILRVAHLCVQATGNMRRDAHCPLVGKGTWCSCAGFLCFSGATRGPQRG